MTKSWYSDLSTTAINNSTIDGNNVAENCVMSGINNAIRGLGAMMAGALETVATATADSGLTYTATLAPAPDGLSTGMEVHLTFGTANSSTTPTINLNGFGAKGIVLPNGNALAIGNLNGNHILSYDGSTNFRVLNPFNLNATPPVAGQVVGTATNDNATAGNIGEFISQDVPSGSAVSLTNVTAANIASISLTAGDWDVWGEVGANPPGGTLLSAILGAINTVSATFPTPSNGGAYMQAPINATGAAGNCNFPIGMMRLSLSATTTVYLVSEASFSGGALSAYGFIGARRRR